jgi:tRNA threonylcarbamoyladenosine biosynthesis protein TsaE
MVAPLFDLTLNDPEETRRFAARIAGCLRPGDTLLLEGEIGAGKTHFARSLIQSIQTPPEDVPSPTFTLIQTYDTTRGEVVHADLYRLSGPDEIAELGLQDAFGAQICLVEWPDRLGPDAPKSALTLRFEQGADPDTRRLTAFGDADTWAVRVGRVEHA